LGSLNGRDYLGDLDIDGRKILKRILKRSSMGGGMDSCSSGEGSVADFCEHENETTGSINGEEFLD
jgi:hypothetical protein